MRRRTLLSLGILGVTGAIAFSQREILVPFWWWFWFQPQGRRTVAGVMAAEGKLGLARLAPALEAAGLTLSTITRLRLLGLKAERRLEVWAASGTSDWRLLKVYPILAASGGPGPKLREGDRQVPEGHYAIESLNPNSRFHLSLRLDYPNAFDRTQAVRDGRAHLGGDIMVHGNAVSIGCLAIGDPAIEEVFALVARIGQERTDALIVPLDLRQAKAADPRVWVQDLYRTLAGELAVLRPASALAISKAPD